MIVRRTLVVLVGIVNALVTLLFMSYVTFGLNKNPSAQTASVSDEIVSQKSEPKPYATIQKPTYGQPIRLEIPKIKVVANVVYLGLTESGDMDNPVDIDDTGWYKYGPHPGEQGSAVIAGHLGVGKAGVFVNLHRLQQGDELFVVDDMGQTTGFVVRESRTYNQNEQPSEVFNKNDGAYLNLITCTGAWDKNKRTLSERLVVFADKTI